MIRDGAPMKVVWFGVVPRTADDIGRDWEWSESKWFNRNHNIPYTEQYDIFRTLHYYRGINATFPDPDSVDMDM